MSDDVVPIPAPDDPAALVRDGETTLEARERLIQDLLEDHEWVDDFLVASLRGEHSTTLVGVAAKDASAAPLFGQIYALTRLHFESGRNRRA